MLTYCPTEKEIKNVKAYVDAWQKGARWKGE